MSILDDKPSIPGNLREALTASAAAHKALLRSYRLALAAERGIDTRRGIRWTLDDRPRRLCENPPPHGKPDRPWWDWWASQGFPRKVAIAADPWDDNNRVTLDPPVILDDPTTLRPRPMRM